ncbi:tyrosine-protein phosphatase [uncultured Campylobacter sp.]|nr:tyrosine-protein phosphatase [uncultured Campylobacter sp.]
MRERQKEGAVLVHCYHGADRTGIVVAMYRVI